MDLRNVGHLLKSNILPLGRPGSYDSCETGGVRIGSLGLGDT